MTGPDDDFPRRVLIISAEMGEGHNAAAAALVEAIEESWPDCQIEWLDTMELRGRHFARAARWAYSFQLNAWPWSYEMLYSWLSRSGRFAAAARAAVGAFFGRSLEKTLEAKNLDVAISTYPFGSAALNWLRKNRGLSTLCVTYIPAFHVHPLWAYDGIDLHFVMYDTASEHALLPGFERSLRVGAPPVRCGFGEVGRDEARRSLGITDDDFVVLVTGGAWGLGDIRLGVDALVKLEPPLHVVAVCGKNAGLETSLRSLALAHPGRLTVYGYISTMPEIMAASNVVVTNGAGVTVLEALRVPRPVVAFAPLAGHGTASTTEMVRRNLAIEALDVGYLVESLRKLRTDPELLHSMEQAGQSWVESRDLRLSVAEIQALHIQRKKGQSGPSATAGNGAVHWSSTALTATGAGLVGRRSRGRPGT
jgi:diacylglycerol O-acyltransferase / wax synthase